MAIRIGEVVRPATDLVIAAYSFVREPEAGQEFILVELIATCNLPSTEECTIFPNSNVQLSGSVGDARYPEFVPQLEDLLYSRIYFAGDTTVSGRVLFIISQEATDLALVYKPQSGVRRLTYFALP